MSLVPHRSVDRKAAIAAGRNNGVTIVAIVVVHVLFHKMIKNVMADMLYLVVEKR